MSLKFQRVTASPEVLSQPVGDEAVLLDLRSEEYFSLNPVGRRVWELLQEGGDVSGVRDRLLAEFEVSASQLEDDLNDLLTRLVDAKLLQEEKVAPG